MTARPPSVDAIVRAITPIVETSKHTGRHDGFNEFRALVQFHASLPVRREDSGAGVSAYDAQYTAQAVYGIAKVLHQLFVKAMQLDAGPASVENGTTTEAILKKLRDNGADWKTLPHAYVGEAVDELPCRLCHLPRNHPVHPSGIHVKPEQ